MQAHNLKKKRRSQISILHFKFPVCFSGVFLLFFFFSFNVCVFVAVVGVFLFCFYFFHWNAKYENAYKELYKTMENHWQFFIKVNFFIIFSFSVRRIPCFIIWISYFSMMQEMLSFRVFFREKIEDHLSFFDRWIISYL